MGTNTIQPQFPPIKIDPISGKPVPASMPPPSAAAQGLGFQGWASIAENNQKIQQAMTPPDQPLQNSGQQVPQPFASVTPPAIAPLASSAPPVNPQQQQLGADTAELRRLQQTGAGVNQIKNPFLRTLGQVGSIAAPFLLGRGAMAIPGTGAHNLWLQDQQAGRVAQDQAAQAADLAQQTGLAGLAKTQAETAAIPVTAGLKKQQYLAALAGKGLREDENGDIVPDESSPVYQKQQLDQELVQTHTDAYKAGVELKNAQADLVKLQQQKFDPNSPIFKQAQQRIAVAQQNANVAGQRAQTSLGRYMQSAFGTDLSRNPLAGSMITDSGDTVGTGNAANVRPTGTQRSKGNMAESADQQIEDMKKIVSKRGDIFGPLAGRKTDFDVWVGSQDPDAQRFRAARTIAGDHLAGTFGGRSEAALSALDAAIGHFRDNPAAVTAGLNQLQEANRLFMKAGTVKTVGGKGNAMAPPTAGGHDYEYVPGKGLVKK